MRTKQNNLRELFIEIYTKGIMFGKNNCDKNTSINSVKDHTYSKIAEFDELAGRVLREEKDVKPNNEILYNINTTWTTNE